MQVIVRQSTRCLLVRAHSASFIVPYDLQGSRGLGSGGKGGGKGRNPLPPFVLLDEDIEERFVKGSGPGGQKINKVRNCVQLMHKPTGITVSCQEARELVANRSIARTRLKEKVEFHVRGDDSKAGRRIAKIRNRKVRSKRRSRIKHGMDAVASGPAIMPDPSGTSEDGDDLDDNEYLSDSEENSDGTGDRRR